jgi:hypothetical protein
MTVESRACAPERLWTQRFVYQRISEKLMLGELNIGLLMYRAGIEMARAGCGKT